MGYYSDVDIDLREDIGRDFTLNQLYSKYSMLDEDTIKKVYVEERDTMILEASKNGD